MRRMLVVLILLVAGVALPASAQEAAQRIAAAERLLERLIETYGVSGHEDAVRELIRSELPAWAKPEVDTAGNLWVRAGKGGAPVVIVAHMDEIGYEITAILDNHLGVSDSSTATYRVLNQSQLLDTATETADTFTVLLAAVAAISLLVGGIGVTNIMLVTVTERTREIGIRKALGAQRATILAQFLAEATILSLLGGALGVAVGVVGSHFTIYGVEPVIVPASILLAFGVSAAIGLFFGSFPANRAAAMLPIDALRYQ